MSKIEINSIASLKRALSQPGIAVIMDESTSMGDYFRRNPEAMRVAGQPRKIKEVRSADAIVERADGMKMHMTFPSRENLETRGDDSFVIITKDSDGRAYRSAYRVVDPGKEYEPSRLTINHPPIDPAIVERERAEAQKTLQDRESRIEAARDRLRVLREEHTPRVDPEYAVFKEVLETVVRNALETHAQEQASRILSEDALRQLITDSPVMKEAEYAEFVQSADILIPKSYLPPESLASHTEAENNISQKPRGAWCEFKQVDDDGAVVQRQHNSAIVSMGDGTVMTLSVAEPLTPASIHARMISRECYEMRNHVEKTIAMEKANVHLEKFSFSVGNTFRDIQIGRERFSTATIQNIVRNKETGLIETIDLSLKKRGSRNSWNASLTAQSLAAKLPEPAQPAITPPESKKSASPELPL